MNINKNRRKQFIQNRIFINKLQTEKQKTFQLEIINIDMNITEDKADLKISLNENNTQDLNDNLSGVFDRKKEVYRNANADIQIDMRNTEQSMNQAEINKKNQNSLKIKTKSSETLLKPEKQKQRPSLQKQLKNNKLLVEIFKHFCNMTYANKVKTTFQEISQNVTNMSLNRFMLFSKQFNIDRIIRSDLHSQKKRQTCMSSQKLKTQETEEKQKIKIEKKSQKTSPKPVMLQIPVKNIHNTEKTLTKLYQKNTHKYDQMTYIEFIEILVQIFEIFQRNIKGLYKEQKFDDRYQIEDKYLSDILVVNDRKKFEEKMSNLKIQFKGAISYHQEPTRISKHKSTSFLNRNLVIHGGRSPDEMKKELQIYQASKIERKQSWIDKQPQTMGVYSKSRVFYRPNPSKVYQTNDVIRLARKQAGRTMTESLFDYSKLESQKRQSMLRREEGLNYSKIFEDKTNKFSEKLQKMKQQLTIKHVKHEKKEQIKQVDNEDQILQKYFENERKVYGDESVMLTGLDSK